MNSETLHRHSMLRVWLPRALGPILLIWILSRVELRQTATAIGQISLTSAFIAYFVFIPSITIRAFRWRIFLSNHPIRIGFWEIFWVYVFSIFLGILTPGRIGEFAKTYHLQRKGMSLGEALTSVILDRAFDLIFLLIAGGIMMLAVFRETSFGERFITILGLGAALFGCIACLLIFKRTRSLVKSVLERLFSIERIAKLKQTILELIEGLKTLRFASIFLAAALTCLAWMFNYYSIYLFATALDLSISYWQILGIASACSLLMLVPISILGVGTRDALLIAVLAQYGISAEKALALSALWLSLMIWSAIVCSLSYLTPAAKFEWRSAYSEQKGDANSQD